MKLAGHKNHAQHIPLIGNRLEEVEKQRIPFVTPIGFIGAVRLCNMITTASTFHGVQ
jgi:hypothetical protein